MKYLGQQFDMTGCPANDYQGERIVLEGVYEVVDFEQEDTSVGIFGSYFVLVHPTANANDDEFEEGALVFVNEDDFVKQADPELWEQWLDYERELETAAEEQARWEEEWEFEESMRMEDPRNFEYWERMM